MSCYWVIFVLALHKSIFVKTVPYTMLLMQGIKCQDYNIS